MIRRIIAGAVIILGLTASVANAGVGGPNETPTYRANNSSQSHHSFTAYLGSGCSGTRVSISPGYGAYGNFRSVKAGYKYQLSLGANPLKTYSANRCVSFNPTGVYVWVS